MQWNILLVDDDKTITSSIHRLIHAEPWHIHIAQSAEEALQLVRRHDIHVMVTDFSMPIMNGIELCKKVQSTSPHTYRLMLSGQLDSPALHEAWREGVVHRFLAKPWDNETLKRDLHEGIRRHLLMRQSHQLMHQLSHQNALLITDQNWIIRYASDPILKLLNMDADTISGTNLFSPTLCDMPSSLEAEVTWQTEHHQLWVGDFRFQGHSNATSIRMTINPLDNNFRVILCESVHEVISPPQNLHQELQRYSGEHQLHRLQEDVAKNSLNLVLLRIEFAKQYENNPDFAAICSMRLQTATDGLHEIYAPKSNVYLLPLFKEPTYFELDELKRLIRQAFIEPIGLDLVTPIITAEQQPQEFAYLSDWLRARSDTSENTNNKSPARTSLKTKMPFGIGVPFFDPAGQIVALQPKLPPFASTTDWRYWFSDAQSHWQSVFEKPLIIMIDASGFNEKAHKSLVESLKSLTDKDLQLQIFLSEEELLSDDKTLSAFRAAISKAGGQFILKNYTGDTATVRKLQHLPITALCLSNNALMQLEANKNTAHDKRIRRTQEQNIRLLAMNIHNTDELIIARNYQLDGISGDLLSPPINLNQLAWFDSV